MKFTLLMEDSTGRKDAMRVIADGLPDALFTFAAEALRENNDFCYCQRKICQTDTPLETFSPKDTEMFLVWKNNGNVHGQKTIREVN